MLDNRGVGLTRFHRTSTVELVMVISTNRFELVMVISTNHFTLIVLLLYWLA